MQKRVHKSVTRAVALTAAFALTVSGLTVHTSAKAAAKKRRLSVCPALP